MKRGNRKLYKKTLALFLAIIMIIPIAFSNFVLKAEGE